LEHVDNVSDLNQQQENDGKPQWKTEATRNAV
jgi:hypothetical protein